MCRVAVATVTACRRGVRAPGERARVTERAAFFGGTTEIHREIIGRSLGL